MSLTDTKVRNSKPTEKTQKLFDGNGMYLEISPKGGKWWRLKYRFAGKEKRISLGVYPDTSLKDARTRKDEARKLLANGVDPSIARKAQKLQTFEAAVNSFEAVGNEWLLKQKHRWSEVHFTKVTAMLEKNLFPWLGSRPISEITPRELLEVLRKIESRGALETAKRTKQVSGQVFRYAVATGRAERDPSQDLKEALAIPVKSHLSAVTEPKAIGPLLLALDGYEGTPTVRAALKLAPLTFVRPGELRNAEWDEIDWETNEWRIPAHKMKTKADHIVPLSRQALAVLQDIQPITGRGQYVFPSARSARRPMSNNAVLSAMRSMGIDKDTMSGHGFRAMARTVLDEVLEYRVDWIEHQLAHAVKDVHGRAYNRTAHLEGRANMMQGWADYLDELRIKSDNVISFRSAS
ncbi:MAG: integrase arm-type DNA-binding domain-containing protein [Porticoccaceae bacterium]|jgi:integrase|nr:integrase arm-type DNA-binding domain-containing protein [Porticoccaceae bacterium]